MIVFLNIILAVTLVLLGSQTMSSSHCCSGSHSDILMLEINLVPKQTRMRKNTQSV